MASLHHYAHIAFISAAWAFPVCLFLAAWALECLRQYDGFVPEPPSAGHARPLSDGTGG